MDLFKYTISETDLRDAENFLTSFMSEKVPEGNFQKGSASRDIMVKGFTALYAFLRGEIDRAEAKQSLLRIQEEFQESDDIQASVDEILSNWFVPRKTGTYATVYVRMHFQQRIAQRIAASTQFWRTASLQFVLDTGGADYLITESQQFPVYDTRGNLTEYVADIPVRAAGVGPDYKVEPGRFQKVVAPNTIKYYSYAENVETAVGGMETESADQMIKRAETAITVRNLINNRSCDATLQSAFPALESTLTIGMGEAEMVRDIPAELGPSLRVHLGGCYDTYVGLPLTNVVETGIVGGYFPRLDGRINAFRDPSLTYQTDGLGAYTKTFTALGVKTGHVLNILSGMVGAPQAYVIVHVSDHELAVSEHSPFPEATDETLNSAVLYAIGYLSPGFAEIPLEDEGAPLPHVYTRTAAAWSGDVTIPYGTSRKISQPGKIVLRNGPILDIIRVEMAQPDSGDQGLVDPSTNSIIFATRVNTPPSNYPNDDPGDTQYQLEVINPKYAQSMQAVNLLSVGVDALPDGTHFTGKALSVSYTTLLGFASIHNYVMGRSMRTVTAQHLIRSRHPVWVTVEVPYALKKGATFDESDAAEVLAKHINEFPSDETLDVSDLSTYLRLIYNSLGAVYPLTAYYHLDAPDGQQAYFSSTDIISIVVSPGNGVILESADITPPGELVNSGVITSEAIESAQDLSAWYNWMGVTDQTVTYWTTASRITFLNKGVS